ncbi:cytochrome C biogenesis protein [Fulvivirga sp. M361]|uniref:cytochrome c biogenesis protein CcsA n=1 Tax=Fulvivirga sp. M361 TaxID=2594266 RepID=UPI00117A50EB|nr:cytochrome c biogenesis protein CcsA [Fulvivirga sp. M361]TRX50957.1 cytochrome C biogenesis protein [Fulvivirga sp. M361]
MMHTFIGDLGHFFSIAAFITALFSSFSYFKASTTEDLDRKKSWRINGRAFFFMHGGSVLGVVVSLFFIIYNHYFEYHYAWNHSSTRLPTHYMVSSFWEGQEGSFLLWMFWHAVLGTILIFTNRFWEPSIMTVFMLVQVFLSSMILGVAIPQLELKIGSSPFILLRDAIDAPIFRENPDFVPKDGTGLNPLLQNYWMVIHPPTLFLGFATTIIPFAYCIAGLWQKKYRDWVRPALPWALFSGAVLGLGILMGGYWAYETLNFGGYWNWDPVENAVYVPWLFLIASIHTMITFKKSSTALKASVILVITTFILILYSTFLTRSGILGNSSVHSFTDLGLSGQLLIYLLVFTILSIVLSWMRWKALPTTEKEASTYSREFWILIGAITLCLMGFQVLVPTSIPVYNSIVEAFGGISNLAPPADQIEYYSKFQLWFAVLVALLSGTGQFFWWKKMDRSQLQKDLTLPIVITLIISTVVILVFNVGDPTLMVLLVAGIYTVVANTKILIGVLKSSPRLSGGAVAHIGVGMMLIGVLFSSGYSKVVSLNNTGMLISRELDEEFNRENLLLFINEPKTMNNYQIKYTGEHLEPLEGPGLVKKDQVTRISEFMAVADNDLYFEGDQLFQANDTFAIHAENTYYAIELTSAKGKKYNLYPRIQDNPTMGAAASPAIKRDLNKDLYAHVVTRLSHEEVEWSELDEFKVTVNENFFVNDYVARFEGLQRIFEVNGVDLGEGDLAVKGFVKIQGEEKEYEAHPVFLVKNGLVGRIPDEVNDLGLRISLMNIHPEENQFEVGISTRQKDWIILKALEKPLINVLWLGTLLLMFGFGIAVVRRYTEFKKMREKGVE